MQSIFSLSLIALLFVSCTPEPEAIRFGKDACEHCKMTIMDDKFGAEIVTTKGKIFKFDSAECMVDFIKAAPQKFTEDMLLTVDVAIPGSLIDARKAIFLNDKAFKSPMGGNLASFKSEQLAENNLQNKDGKILSWEQLLKSR